MNYCDNVKKSVKSTNQKFNVVCVKPFDVNARICGKTVHDSCTTTMHLHTLNCLFVSFWTRTIIMISQSYIARFGSLDFFLYPKIKTNLKGHFAIIEEVKSASLKEQKDIFKTQFQKCFEVQKKRWNKCVISNKDYFEGITLLQIIK